MNTDGTAKRRDLPRKARGHGATATEPPRVGRVLQRLQKFTQLVAHETCTVTTETTKGRYIALPLLMMKKKDLLPRDSLNRQ
ncbi:hypothetical protein KP17_02855 [Pectobacterium parvum]|nr:hypothetical protein KP17_02855 [Pectobacterium parvum]